MSLRRAVFYLNLGPQVGLGHAVRCSALAEALRAHGWACSLLGPAGAGAPPFVSAAFRDELPGNAELFVIDHYEPDLGVVEAWRRRAAKVLQVHDGGGRPVLGDLVLNQNADAVAAGRGFFGPEYALLRQAFAERRPLAKPSSQRAPASRVLVMPGSTDVGGMCRMLAAASRPTERLYTFVLSKLAPDYGELSRQVLASGGTLSLVSDATADRVADLLLAHDMVVGNAGSGSFERCALGVPSVMVIMADNQRGNAAALAARGAALLAGEADDNDVRARVEAALQSPPDTLRQLSEKAFAVTDGLGAFRVAMALAPESVTLRPVGPSDCERTYAWQQHPETRRYSREPEVPAREEHVAWFGARLRDHRCIFSMVVADGAEVGVLRLDYREMRQGKPCYEVSINVDPSLHGRGIGSAALRAARRLTPFAWRKAFVDERNAASLALFGALGYGRDGSFLYDPPLC